MKKIIFIALVAFTMISRAQTPVTNIFYHDTIVGDNGIKYLNTSESIESYHELDSFVCKSELDKEGNWTLIYYNGTSKGKLYVYYMDSSNLCWKLNTFTDRAILRATKKLMRKMSERL